MNFVYELYNSNSISANEVKSKHFLQLMKNEIKREVIELHSKGKNSLKGHLYHFFLDGDNVIICKDEEKPILGSGFANYSIEYIVENLKKYLNQLGFKKYKVSTGSLQFYEVKPSLLNDKFIESHLDETIYIDLKW